MIVKPSKGRAIFSRNSRNLEINIPSKKNIGIVIFSLVWLTGWAFGEYFAYQNIVNSDQPLFANLFLLVWITGWTIGGFFVMYSILWILFGVEIISINRKEFSISKKIFGIGFTKRYELNSIKNLDINNLNEVDRSQKQNFSRLSKGNLKFDYGMKTIKFASDIDEAEANYILEKLKSDTRFKEDNFKLNS